MTAASVAAIEECIRLKSDVVELKSTSESPLQDPEIGRPISHGQLIDISRFLRKAYQEPEENKTEVAYHLEDLLRGARIYTPAPAPKKEPSNEYKALMARLREEEEARQYERMLNPPLKPETFAERFANSPHAHLFPSDHIQEEDDEATYADVNRQLALIINVLVSIIACSFAIWIAARHWSVPPRLALSLSGSGIVAIAEVAIYSGYIKKVQDAKQKEKKKMEKKEVFKTWVVDSSGEKTTGRISSGQARNRKLAAG
ncbi:MAG: hypothetical protein M1820_001622 [Bogoriella megaspora]|nr:MAG: hypothetical protein M1820_001622 [Bogoriella megaspora]